MIERQLPPAVLQKATLRGNEYAWPLDTVEEVIRAAAGIRLATIAGQTQFRLPDGTYEIYRIGIETSGRGEGELWEEYIARNRREVTEAFRRMVASTDFNSEVHAWPPLQEKMERGEPILEYLCVVLYFESEDEDGG